MTSLTLQPIEITIDVNYVVDDSKQWGKQTFFNVQIYFQQR